MDPQPPFSLVIIEEGDGEQAEPAFGEKVVGKAGAYVASADNAHATRAMMMKIVRSKISFS